MDRTLIAAQVGRIYADAAAEALTFGAIAFPATFEPYVPTPTDTDRDVLNNTVVIVKGPRALLGATPPRKGQHFNGTGRIYQVHGLPSMPPSDPVIKFICTVTALA